MIYFWGILCSIVAVSLESYMKMQGSYIAIMWVAVPASTVINFCVYQMVHLAPSLPAAFIVFGFANLLSRTCVSIWQGHQMGPLTWVAIGLMTLAVIVREVERRGLLY